MLLVLKPLLELSYTQVGVAATVFTLASSLTQPFFGYLADRFGARMWAIAGLTCISIFIGLATQSQSFATLVVWNILAGLGSGAFHPVGGATAARAGGIYRGASMSIFLVGGNTGFAFGPLIWSNLYATFGREGGWFFTLGGLILTAILFFAMRSLPRGNSATSRSAGKKERVEMGVAPLTVVILMLVILTRSWTHTTMTTYLPQHYNNLGFSIGLVSSLLSGFLFPLALGSLLGGFMADHFGRKKVLGICMICLVPAMWFSLDLSNLVNLAGIPVAGFLIGMTLPITLIMAQDIFPKSMGIMTGMAFGFTFVAGAMGQQSTGIMADAIGLNTSLHLVALLPAVGAILTLLLPSTMPSGVDKGNPI